MSTTPHKSDHASLLNALDDMQQTLLYKARKNVLSQAETLIVSQEQQIKELKEKLIIQRIIEQPSNPAPLSDDDIFHLWLMRDCIEAIRAGDLRGQLIAFTRSIEARIVGQQTKGGGNAG